MKRLAAILLIGAGSLLAQESAAAKNENSIELWKWANFGILAVALGIVIAKRVPGIFRDRTFEIQKGIAEAQQVKRDAEKRAAEMDARMSRLGAEIEAFRTQAKAEMEHEGGRIRQETAAQLERIQRQAAFEVDAAGKTAQRELREYAANLALDLAAQRIRARVNPASDAALVSGFVQELERQGARN